MKTSCSFLLIFFLLLTSKCLGQDFKPSYQSNPSLDFNKFLNGVKIAYVFKTETMDELFTKYPNHPGNSVIEGLIKYLKMLGFEYVKSGTNSKYTIENVPTVCDVVWIYPTFQISNSMLSNIKLSFVSCNKDVFNFESSKEFFVTVKSEDLTSLCYNTFMSMYCYHKDSYFGGYNIQNRLSLKTEISEWTEDNFKRHLIEKGCDQIEGIYEMIRTDIKESKYKLGLINNNEEYKLIYLAGATNFLDWKEGEIKATLYPTATTFLFKTDWKMSNKSLNKDYYITFEPGLMNFLDKNNKTVYVKLPTSNDNNFNSSSRSASGTGFAISSNGLIITNNHVINNTNSIKIRGINGDFTKTYNAKLVVKDKNSDLALLKIDDPDLSTLGTIPFMINNKTLDVGSSVFLMGYPLRSSMGDEIKVTNGIISSKSGYQGDVSSYQFSAPVQPGNSGGPLFDLKGNLIGIVNAKLTDAENVSYAVKSIHILNLFDLLDSAPKFPTSSSLSNLPLTEQIKILKKFTYIIEVN